ncbi:MAG: IPTL-CTERM sorting domain-containing protein [Vicinamibacteria bacterium]
MTKTINPLRRGISLLPLAGLGLIAQLVGAPAAFAQMAPPLGTTQRFTLLGGSAATGASGLGAQIDGDVGSSPTATVSNFPPSTVTPPFILHLGNDAVVQQAHLDGITAFNGLNQGAGMVIADNLSGATLTSGVYTFMTGAPNLPSGATLTLSGPGIFVLRAGTTLNAGTNSTVNLIGGANACNVFWQVGSSATLIGTTFSGTVIANTSVTIGSGASLVGRAIANNGAVTLSGAGPNAVGGCATAVVPVCPLITISPISLVAGTAGVPYNQMLMASGGSSPYVFGLTAGSLPAGLTLSTGGTVSGTPAGAGSSTFTIRATDFNACVADMAYMLAVAPLGCTVTVSPVTLPNGTKGVPYTQTLTASGGVAPYAFTVVAGSLPAGLTLAGDVLSGTPTAGSTFTIRATAANGCFGDHIYTFGAVDPVPTMGEWGMVLLFATLGLAGFAGMRKQTGGRRV